MTKFEDMAPDYQGQLLLATPKMTDYRFEKAVILICSHNADGAMGIIVNKPALKIDISSILNKFKFWKDKIFNK